MNSVAQVRVGCAGWSIARQHAERFPATGSHLRRYADRFRAVEINSSFYRPHRPATYARWAASVPQDFLFAVKVPKEITHTRRLVDCEDILASFLAEVQHLGEQLGVLLIQLPPSFALDERTVVAFFELLRGQFSGAVALEPRHRSWFAPAVDELLGSHRIARVAADPALEPAAGVPGGVSDLVYYRLHGSPDMYYSSYTAAYLAELLEKLASHPTASAVWCIFDNTALGAATENALWVQEQLASG